VTRYPADRGTLPAWPAAVDALTFRRVPGQTAAAGNPESWSTVRRSIRVLIRLQW